MEKTTLERIMQQTGCAQAQDGCERGRGEYPGPCLCTPHDVLRLIDGGYGPQLEEYNWDEGLQLGKIGFAVHSVRIAPLDDGCPFRRKMRCTLEVDGLKPTGGRLSERAPEDEPCRFEQSLDWNIVREWVLPENTLAVSKAFELMHGCSVKAGYYAPLMILIFNASRTMIAMTNSLQTAAWLTGGVASSIAMACQGRYVATAGLYFRRRHPRIVIDDSDWQTLKLEKYDALCGEHRRYYSRQKMKSLREEFEKKKVGGQEIDPEKEPCKKEESKIKKKEV